MKKIQSLPLGLGLALILAVGAALSTAKAQTIVFTEDWETDQSSTGNYRTNFAPVGVSYANLYFDYSTAGIPLSPHSTGVTTRALKIQRNYLFYPFGHPRQE